MDACVVKVEDWFLAAADEYMHALTEPTTALRKKRYARAAKWVAAWKIRHWVEAANLNGVAPTSARCYETYAAEMCRQSADEDVIDPIDVPVPGGHKSLMKRWRRQFGLVVSDLPERPLLERDDLREKVALTTRNVMILG